MTQAIVYNVHVFYKGMLQKKVLQWLKKISAHFDHYNLIKKKNQRSKFGMKVPYQFDFKVLRLDLLNNA